MIEYLLYNGRHDPACLHGSICMDEPPKVGIGLAVPAKDNREAFLGRVRHFHPTDTDKPTTRFTVFVEKI